MTLFARSTDTNPLFVMSKTLAIVLFGALLAIASASMVVAKPVKIANPCGKVAMVKQQAAPQEQFVLVDGQLAQQNDQPANCYETTHLAIPAFVIFKSPAPTAVRFAPRLLEMRSAFVAIELPPPRLSA